MSAPPSAAPNGATSTAPPARKPKASVFNTRNKKPIRRPPPPGQQPTSGAALNRPPTSVTSQPLSTVKPEEDEGSYEEYPIVINKLAIDAGARFHAFKLQTKVDQNGKPTIVSPFSADDFPRPLRLFRRYGTDKMEQEQPEGEDDKERQAMLARQADRDAEREENRKLIAPTGDANRPAKKKQQKKVEEGRDEGDPVRQKRRQIRYEEAKRWHLEDKQGKNIWAGNYEEALSESSIMLRLNGDRFDVVPIERWYKFIQVNRVDSMTSEEVEKFLAKKTKVSRWARRQEEQIPEVIKQEMIRKAKAEAARAALYGDEMKQEDDGDFQADRDMLDLEVNDEFQDDDEGALFQGDDAEDTKELERKIYLSMREAGLSGTGVKNEELDPEEEERKRALEELEEKRKSKRLRRQLQKREHKGEYESDSDDDRYGSSSDSDDTDAEAEKDEEAKKKEEEAKTSTKGTNTPSGRPEKRPNPDASDASGNESSRKRAKITNGTSASAPGGARSLSPDAARPKKIKAPRSTAGSGSGSDTDTSRVGRPKKLKVKNSPPGSPNGNTPSGSRAASPSGTQTPKTADNFPTLSEISAAIPQEGIKIPMLVALFKTRVGKRGSDFINLVKQAGIQDKAQPGVIRPKPAQ